MSNKKNLLPQYEIEGFDPNECLTVVQEIVGEGQVKETLFMRFQESLAWFLSAKQPLLHRYIATQTTPEQPLQPLVHDILMIA